MNDRGRIWQVLHQLAGAASMIQVYVGEKNVVNVCPIDSLEGQNFEQAGNTVCCPGIDECRPPPMDEQMARIHERPNVLRVYGSDAIVEVGEPWLDPTA